MSDLKVSFVQHVLESVVNIYNNKQDFTMSSNWA